MPKIFLDESRREVGGTFQVSRPTFLHQQRGSFTYALSHVFDSRATHARTLLPAALASVPFGFVLVRVRVL